MVLMQYDKKGIVGISRFVPNNYFSYFDVELRFNVSSYNEFEKDFVEELKRQNISDYKLGTTIRETDISNEFIGDFKLFYKYNDNKIIKIFNDFVLKYKIHTHYMRYFSCDEHKKMILNREAVVIIDHHNSHMNHFNYATSVFIGNDTEDYHRYIIEQCGFQNKDYTQNKYYTIGLFNSFYMYGLSKQDFLTLKFKNPEIILRKIHYFPYEKELPLTYVY